MKNLLIIPSIFLMLLSSGEVMAQMTQKEQKKILNSAYPGKSNTKLIQFSDIKSSKVKDSILVDFGFEMGDGYYDVMASAIYMVFSEKGELAGFMHAALMSYTEDPEFYLVAAKFTTNGERLDEEVDRLDTFTDVSEFKSLPKELQPKADPETQCSSSLE